MIIRFISRLFLLVILVAVVSSVFDALRYVVAEAPKLEELDALKGTLTQVSGCPGRRSGVTVTVRDGADEIKYGLVCALGQKLASSTGRDIEIRKRSYPGLFFFPVDEVWSVRVGNELIYSPEVAEEAIRNKFHTDIFASIVFAVIFFAMLKSLKAEVFANNRGRTTVYE